MDGAAEGELYRGEGVGYGFDDVWDEGGGGRVAGIVVGII